MKRFWIISLVLITACAFGQDYKLFNASSRKVFSNFPIPDSALSIAFDSVRMEGTDSVYYNFKCLGNTINTNNCQFWGHTECTKQDRPGWLGSKVIYNNSNTYQFFSNAGQILNFNFSVTTGQPILFYENATEKFYFSFTGADTLSVSGINDSSKVYTILHTDSNGATINSSLNGKNIIIAKNLGLVQFFQVDLFPQILNSVYLIGQQEPELGLHALTNEILYNYSVGDVVQYYEKQHYNYGPPEWNYDRFIRLTILSKNYTADSVVYTANKHAFDKGASTSTDKTVLLKYKLNQIITQAPFEYTDPTSYLMINRGMHFTDYCGTKRWTYREKPEYALGYCENENCWGPRDIPGPPPFEETIYTCGLGICKDAYYEFAFYPTDPGRDYVKEIIYFKKNGVSCGTEAFVGFDDDIISDDLFFVKPVPATDFITIETTAPEGSQINIYTISGQDVLSQKIEQKSSEINISQLKSGLYLVKLTSGKHFKFQKFIKH